MGGIERIIRRLTVLVVRLQKDEEAEICRVEVTRKKKTITIEGEERFTLEGMGEKKMNSPVLLIFTGYGIIRKVYEQEEMGEAERIMQNDDFVWEQRQGGEGERVIAFTRKERVEAVLEKLRQGKARVIEMHIGEVTIENEFPSGKTEHAGETALRLAGCFYRKGIGWKELGEAGERGNMLSALVAAKLRLPLLGCLLGLLLVNYLWNGAVRDKYAVQEAELALLKKDVSSREKLSREMQQVVTEFKANAHVRYALILDRIASRVPIEVVLRTLILNPLLKSPEDRKPLLVREGQIEVTGETPEPEKVTLFTARLTACDFTQEVKLISLDRNRDTGKFDFKILIRL